MEERSASVPTAGGDNSPGHGVQAGLTASAHPAPVVPVDKSGARPTFPGRRERTRSRLARLTGRGTATYSPILEPLLRTVRANNPKEDFDLIQRAFEVAEQSHRGQKRKSGDPYITHPVAVATILAELGLSGTTLAAALLHDTVEDTPYTLADLKRDFGPEVAMLVDGVTKLDKVSFGEAAQSETVRKMVVAMAKDIRVLMIKLADRLHNARTWRFVSAESSARKARETLEIFAPLAHRLGMNTIKWELEDLSFAALYPKVYEEIVRMVGDRTPEREKSLGVIRDQITEDLRTARIKATITGRPKHYYSIYQKMIVRDKDFDDINDLMGVRVLVDSVRDCYAALGTMHSRWNPLPGRFKDYIAMPKFNMYQSLHTTVIGPGGKPVEIQIRTHEMHRRAEYGVAAHWKYKDQPSRTAVGPGSPRDGDMGWLRSLVDWQQETSDPGEFLDSLRFEINAREVFVFTPKGEVMALPAGSTPVDFAYAVHTEVGHRTIGARVNGKLVPLNSELNHGDWVEIFTSKAEGAGPSQDWQHFVKSARARNKIRQWFSKERREEAIDRGKELLTRAMRKQNLPLQRLMTHEALAAVAAEFKYVDISGLYAGVGDGHTSAQSVMEKLVESLGGNESTDDDITEVSIPTQVAKTKFSDSGVVVRGVGDVWVKLARCCTPVPPDPILGFVTRGSGVSVHRTDCTNISDLRDQPDRIVEVDWAPTQSSVFLVEIQVEALDRKSLLSDVTRVLSENHVNILAASVNTSTDRVAISRFAFEMGDPKYLSHVLSAVRRIDGVFDVYRTTGNKRRS
ncbi:bifunctional (p)ppGpp synthetase/guanosine-3',5'-bis(diphosphate) 3'-pyrophosphohydrolase [Pseudarthrobacter sp. NIBRBAC000502772]|uniref:RelA/SpoT family protein n=1 Tax=Pseudarthrobacter sp. NIBRBAC000502772 TaxID=2590775 RepID=UPI0011300B9A|nr:bifunctional (p)ppGpp synthetase/guanosine-3',5'-bis(diphosphate) 3'-pyrophosphohydrolase [Pseudarthrobacter sp. NIBRBAC000502772]QDG67261.1 bifunctional (p)ppGpp synthetase/guanosine-3',5'-bis(diphosphate) 3'-pyrophosphohydrolase [Pseudarthrobacter sp. NIBRBAC000502772]